MTRPCAIAPVLLAGCGPLPDELELRFLGVGGFTLRYGDDAVMTAPMFTNPDVFNEAIASRTDLVDRYLGDVRDVRAILSGHAHYDHLMDVPYARNATRDAPIYTNTSGRHLLAAFLDDPPPGCADRTGPPEDQTLTDDAIVALDDPGDDVVDYRSCPGVATCEMHADGASGAWVDVRRTDVRVRALCSLHPPQFLDVHLGEGCVTEDECDVEPDSNEWREGTTLAFLVDFLDRDGSVGFRVYVQDAPTTAPIGLPSDDLSAEHAVDLAILNGGNYDQVEDHPGGTIAVLDPRYVVIGHWEDFFRTLDEPVEPQPFLDLDDLRARLEAALPGGEGTTWWIPDPGFTSTFR
jgi:hypothetical protein